MIDEHEGWDESAYKFNLRCEGFYHLCGGLLKLHNVIKESNVNVSLIDDLDKACDVHKKICDDFIGKGE